MVHFLLFLLLPLLVSSQVTNITNDQHRLDYIRNLTRSAWKAYRQNSWGRELFRPISKSENLYDHLSGRTILGALSTLKVMKLEDEFQEGAKWIRESSLHLNNQDDYFYLPEIVTNYIGGLLSAYALTGEQMFLDRAKVIEGRIRPAFNSSTGLPYLFVNLKSGSASGNQSNVGEFGFRQPELVYLAHLTGSNSLKDQLSRIETFVGTLKSFKKEMNIESGQWTMNSSATNAALSKFLWTGYLQSYRQSGRQDTEVLAAYEAAESARLDGGLVKSRKSGNSTWIYSPRYELSQWHSSSFPEYMSSASCELGAFLAVGGRLLDQQGENISKSTAQKLWNASVQITETCHLLANQTKTKLIPERVNFWRDSVEIADPGYSLSPELPQALFTLWRLTHDQKYRQYAWQLALAIGEHCQVETGGGFGGAKNVNEIPTRKFDAQQPHFLSATLKYLYLTFTEDSVIPIDQWIINAAGHPLPVCGKNAQYPVESCSRSKVG